MNRPANEGSPGMRCHTDLRPWVTPHPRSWPAKLINDASSYAKAGNPTRDGIAKGAPKKTPISAHIGKRYLVFINVNGFGGRTEWR